MIYIDSSCLVKIFRQEHGSADVLKSIGAEIAVIISTLAELETLVQLKGYYLSGAYSLARWREMEARLSTLRNQPPYEFRGLSSTLFPTALRQHRNSREVHCRTLDRLHLAAMEELEVNRLMTHDDRQAKAAREAGFEVVQPGRR